MKQSTGGISPQQTLATMNAEHDDQDAKVTSFLNNRGDLDDEQLINDIINLLTSQQYGTFLVRYLSSAKILRAVVKCISKSTQYGGMTILHAAVRYEPPLAIVAKIINFCPELLSAKDCLGRTPLHVAAGLRVSPLLIRLIAHAYPAACYTVDDDGKTPLHLTCDSSCELFEEDEDNPTPLTPPNHNSIQALLSESLKAVTIEDFDEINPIEYAIMSNASLKTVKLLQFSSSMCLQRGYSGSKENERPTMNWLIRDQPRDHPRDQQKALKRRRITIG